MTDPYKVLGISPNATDDEVKRAYKELSRKYHPDSYVNNPLADLAEDKFKEVQAAYTQIMDARANGGSGYSQGYQGGEGGRVQGRTADWPLKAAGRGYFDADCLRFFIQRTTTSASMPSASATAAASTITNSLVMPLMPPLWAAAASA